MSSTIKEVSKLHKQMRNENNDSDSEFSDSDSVSDTSESEISEKQFHSTTPKKVSNVSNVSNVELLNRKETMLYMFTRFENLQNLCNDYKFKNHILKCRIKDEEKRKLLINLEYSNVILDKKELIENLSQLKKIVYILCFTNFGTLLFLFLMF